MRKLHIEHDPEFSLANYFVMDEKGMALQACFTLWGARRWAKKHGNDKITRYTICTADEGDKE